jgi:uncharacterized protein involved in exopolysaccharide biosynthesis
VRVARALATAATDSLNHVGQSGLESALKAIDDQIVKLSQQRATLAQQLTQEPRNQQLQAKLAGLDEVIANFTGDRGRILIQASTQGLAGVIDAPARPAHPVPSALPQKLGLAAPLGVVAAIRCARGRRHCRRARQTGGFAGRSRRAPRRREQHGQAQPKSKGQS